MATVPPMLPVVPDLCRDLLLTASRLAAPGRISIGVNMNTLTFRLLHPPLLKALFCCMKIKEIEVALGNMFVLISQQRSSFNKKAILPF